MTLGEIIREYLYHTDSTVTDFSKATELSRAYIYMLMKDKNNEGGKIVPSMETVKRVARGVHLSLDDVIKKLDDDYVVEITGKKTGFGSTGQVIPEYYLDPEAAELAEFLHKNPDYKVLFDASRNVKPEDIEFVCQMIDRMGGKNES